ncbi:MAG: heme exporter protein CcmD [Rubrivivax sp.]
MNWGSASEFFAMGGHGAFVWGSYAVFALVVALEPWLAGRRRRAALRAAARHTPEDET